MMLPACFFTVQSKACEYKWVLRCDLNICREVDERTEKGRSFHTLGATTENAWSPLHLRRGTLSIVCELDLSDLEEVWTDPWCTLGTNHWLLFKMNSKILKTISCLTGSQSKEARIGVIWSLFLVFVSSLDAAFWTNCNLDRDDWQTPAYNTLQ